MDYEAEPAAFEASEPIQTEVTEGLSYDDTVEYDEQLPAGGALAARIGKGRVYTPADAGLPPARAAGKRKRGEDPEDTAIEDESQEDDLTIRSNALTLHGTPITHLPTARIFAYAGHFDAQPVALEWVSDDTCVLVFESRTHARAALRALQKTGSEEMPDEDGFVTGQPVPVALWPAEERIAQSLGAGDGLRGAVLVRRALQTDVKARGAAKVSEFYAKHGANAGKEVTEPRRAEVDIDEADDGAPRKRRRGGRRRRGQANDDDAPREALEDMGTSSPPALAGRLRSDNIGNDGRSLLQRTSVLRSHDRDDDEDMATDDSVRDSSRRGDRREGGGEGEGRRRRGGRNRRGGGGEGNGERTKTAERPKKTQAELDAELDAFFNNRG